MPKSFYNNPDGRAPADKKRIFSDFFEKLLTKKWVCDIIPNVPASTAEAVEPLQREQGQRHNEKDGFVLPEKMLVWLNGRAADL